MNYAHALDCCRGGLVIQHHNEVRDALGDIAALTFREVIWEPVVRERTEESPALIADLGVRGVWVPQVQALFDVRVTDTDAPSYLPRFVDDVFAMAETEKLRKYGSAADAGVLHSPHLLYLLMVQWAMKLACF